MCIGSIADPVKLQVGITQSRICRLLCELKALGEFNSISSGLDGVISNFPGITHRIQEIRR